MTSSLYQEISPSTNLKPCSLSHREFLQQTRQSVPGQGRRFQHLRKQFLNGTISRRYGKYEADIVRNVKTDKKVYPANQAITSQQGASTVRLGQPREADGHKIRIPANLGFSGLDFEWRMSQLHEANSK